MTLSPPPQSWDTLLNDGFAAIGRKDLQTARAYFAAARAQQGANAVQWFELGQGYRHLGDLADAESALRAALDQAPAHIEALEALGDVLTRLGRDVEAAQFICQAFVLRPAEGQAPKMRATAYYILGRVEEAAAVYKAWLEREPDNATAAHLYAACAGTTPPARASDAYLSATFDAFAGHFDRHLKQLDYQVPSVFERVMPTLAPPGRQWRIVDGGCGTGLLGPILSPWASRLTGIDLSMAMLQQAHTRGVYHDLVHAELTDELARHPASCELLCMADTLIYFGEVNALLKAAQASLTAGGLLLFSVELHNADAPHPYRLQPSGRYAHQAAYIAHSLAEAGIVVESAEPITLRTELGRAVAGMFYIARRPT